MKIVCTHCQAGYNVDLPEIKPEGVEFKCAKCEQKFLVKPQDTEQAKANILNKVTAATGTSSEKASGSVVEEEERSPAENQSTPQQEQEPPPEDNLDNLLDDLLKEDLAPDPGENTLEAEEEQKTEAGPATSTEGADNLDGLLDDLITDDIAAGSTVTKKAPADALVIGRARQANREGYAALLKERIRRRKEVKNKGN